MPNVSQLTLKLNGKRQSRLTEGSGMPHLSLFTRMTLLRLRSTALMNEELGMRIINDAHVDNPSN